MSTPEELRKLLTDAGWKEQSGTAMEVTKRGIGLYAQTTWWNRGDELVLLIEDEWEYDGAGDRIPRSAFLAQEISPRLVVASEPESCDECGNEYPPEARSLEGPWHKDSCSLYDGLGVTASEGK